MPLCPPLSENYRLRGRIRSEVGTSGTPTPLLLMWQMRRRRHTSAVITGFSSTVHRRSHGRGHQLDAVGRHQRDHAAAESAAGHPGTQRAGLHRGIGDQIDVRGGDREVVTHRRMRRGEDPARLDIVRITQRRNEIQHPLVLGQHMPGATGVDGIGDPAESRDIVISRSDTTPMSAAARSQDSRRAAYSPPT